MIKLVSVNAFNLYGNAANEARFEQVETMIRRADADIVAVQEVVAQPPQRVEDVDKRVLAERRVRKLADAVGLRCEAGGEVMFALGGGIHHTALLWRDGLTPGNVEIAPVPGMVARFEREPAGMWHSLVTAVFDLGGAKLRVGSVQLSPFDPGRGWVAGTCVHECSALSPSTALTLGLSP